MYSTQKHTTHKALIGIALMILSSLVVVFLAGCGSQQATRSTLVASVPVRHVNLNLDIIINHAGYQKDWPAFAPSALTVPANSIVTVTLRNFDLGDTPLSNGSPFTKVQGTIGGSASVDGHSYTELSPDKVAHTFSVPQLNLSVPIPGDGITGQDHNTVTFTFKTGATGTYTIQCYDPCGTGSSGWMGPMAMKGYMSGTLIVQG